MRILFDHGTPERLAWSLRPHAVTLARECGWDTLSNGDLLRVAEDAGFDLFLSTDGGIRYQQNLKGRKIAIVVLTGCTKWLRVRQSRFDIVETIEAATIGSYTEVPISFR
jgi:hypothetical protein